MLTIDGGEEIDVDRLPEYRPQPHWSRIVAASVLAVSFLILLRRPRRHSGERAPTE